jgi:hypothetical protein
MLGDRWLIFPDLRKTNRPRTLNLPPGNWYHWKFGGKPVQGKIRVTSGIQFFVSENYWMSKHEKSDVELIWQIMRSTEKSQQQ